MNDFLDAICTSLRSVGLDAEWESDYRFLGARLKVAGTEFRCHERPRRRVAVVIDYREFTRPARGTFDTEDAVQYIIERLPQKLTELELTKTQDFYREAAEEMRKRWKDEMHSLVLNHSARGITVSLTFADPLHASVFLDFIDDYGIGPKNEVS